MAEEHNRVLPKNVVSSSGQRSDPDAIRGLEEEAGRRERAWRNRPDRSFGDVLETAAQEPDAEAEAEAEAEASDSEDAPKEEGAKAAKPDDVPAPVEQPELARPPDPREAQLHAILTAKKRGA